MLSISAIRCINHTFHVFCKRFHAIISLEMSNHFIQSSVQHSHRIWTSLNWYLHVCHVWKHNIHLTHYTVGVSLLMAMLFPMEIGVEQVLFFRSPQTILPRVINETAALKYQTKIWTEIISSPPRLPPPSPPPPPPPPHKTQYSTIEREKCQFSDLLPWLSKYWFNNVKLTC